MKDYNVIGTHAAARRLPAAPGAAQARRALVDRRVRRVVPRPGRVHRGHRAARDAARRLRQDIIDIEGYVRGFRRRRPDVTTTVLRFAPFVGPDGRHHADALLRPAGRADHLRPRPAAAVHPRRRRARGPASARWSRTTRARSTWPAAGCSRFPGDPAGRPGRRPVLEPGMSAFAAFAKASGIASSSSTSSTCSCTAGSSTPRRLVEEFGFEPRRTAEAFDDLRPRPSATWAPAAAPPSRTAC